MKLALAFILKLKENNKLMVNIYTSTITNQKQLCYDSTHRSRKKKFLAVKDHVQIAKVLKNFRGETAMSMSWKNGEIHTISSFIVLICNDLKCFLLKTVLRTRCSFFSLQHSFPFYVTSSTSYKRFMNCLYDVNSNNIALTMHLTFLQFFTRCSAI